MWVQAEMGGSCAPGSFGRDLTRQWEKQGPSPWPGLRAVNPPSHSREKRSGSGSDEQDSQAGSAAVKEEDGKIGTRKSTQQPSDGPVGAGLEDRDHWLPCSFLRDSTHPRRRTGQPGGRKGLNQRRESRLGPWPPRGWHDGCFVASSSHQTAPRPRPAAQERPVGGD